jgi:hypothetical protein
MEYSLSSLLDLVGAFLLGMFIMEKIIFNRIRKALEEAGVDFEAEDKPEVVKVNKYFIENINGLLYLYDFTTNNFIVQGNTLEELAILTKDKSNIAGVKYNEEVIWFVDGKVKTTV